MSEWHLHLRVLMGSAVWVLVLGQPIAAQVIPDGSLPVAERSQVSGNPDFQIDGGARRGGNLFHSFSQFSIPTGGSAFFNNAADVQNIFARVTGGSASDIDGEIRANGTANLFLLNPNGILFGANASLNVGGSFLATTANAIGFPNGEVFSSDAAQPVPNQLLTVNPNALFFNQLTPQPIVNRSTFNDVGLQVPSRQNLLLVGGSVQLDDGRLATPGSYVEVGSVGGVGRIDLTTTPEDWQLNIPDAVARADVSLINNSRINVLAGGGGSIAIAARNLSISDESRLRVGIEADSGFVGAQAGGIQIDATETVNLANGGTIRTEVLPRGTGNVGNMTINTGSLVLTGNSKLISATSGQGNVGSVDINARNTVSFNDSFVLGTVQNAAVGNTGGINISTGSLVLTEGSQLIFGTRGQGNAGNVTINARNTVSLDSSSIFNTVDLNSVGNAGGINITAESLSLTGGAQLSSSTSGQGNAGNVTINARDRLSLDGESADGTLASTIFTQVAQEAVGQGGDVSIATGTLFLTNGGAINTANTGGTGNAGRVTIQARDVQIRGTAPILTANRSGIFTSATAGSVGNGGDVSITTGSLSVSDRGRIITNAEGQGNAGNIQIQAGNAVLFDRGDAITTLSPGAVGRGGDIEIAARSLSLLNGAQLAANTAGRGNAGNIRIATSDALTLRQGSDITTNATGSNLAGGNIAIDTQFLVAVPSEDSNINANSEDFRGGNVRISAVATFGIQPSFSSSSLSDITATGATSALSGAIDVTTAGINPNAGLVVLPTTLVDSSQQIAQGCPADRGNSFVISGRGGLPPNPTQQLDDDADWQDRRRLTVPQPAASTTSNTPIDRPTANAAIVEATGWQTTPTGEVRLVASTADSAVQNALNRSIACSGRP